MRQRTVVMAFALLVIGAGLVFAGGAGETGAGGGPTTLTVTGVGTVVGVPDTAVFSVGVQVVGTSPGDVLNESRARSESVQEALRNLGIRERNIQTTHYNMHTERYPTGPDQRPTEMRYVATTGLRIDLTDLDRLDEVFSTATSAGATELWGIQFGVSDSAARHDEARVAALEDARRKAEELAAAQGLSIVAVDSISTNQQAGPGLFEGVQPQGRGAAGGAVSPGELEFREAVTVTYTAR